jgi:hypothetical protein
MRTLRQQQIDKADVGIFGAGKSGTIKKVLRLQR